MPESDLKSMIDSSSGRLLIGRSIDYSGVFEVLGSDADRRIEVIGQDGQSNGSSGGQERIIDDELQNMTFTVDGIWVKDNKLKLVKMGLVLYGNAPYLKDEKYCLACDPSTANDNMHSQGFVGKTISFPKALKEDLITALENKDTEVRAGICISPNLADEYMKRYFPPDNFSQWNSGDFQKLIDNNLVYGEVIWKTSDSGGKVYKLPILDVYSLPLEQSAFLKFPACLAALTQYNQVGIKLQIGNEQIYDTNTPIPQQLKYDWQSGKTGVTTSVIKQWSQRSDGKVDPYKPLNNSAVFVRFFGKNESEVKNALGHNVSKEFFDTLGSNAAYQVKQIVDIAQAGGGAAAVGTELIWFALSAIAAFEGTWTQCCNPRDRAGVTIGHFSYTSAHHGKIMGEWFDKMGRTDIGNMMRSHVGRSLGRDNSEVISAIAAIKGSGLLTNPEFQKLQFDQWSKTYLLNAIKAAQNYGFTTRIGYTFVLRTSLMTGGISPTKFYNTSYIGSAVNSLPRPNGNKEAERAWLSAAFDGMVSNGTRQGHGGWVNEANKVWKKYLDNLDTDEINDNYFGCRARWGTVPGDMIHLQSYCEQKFRDLGLIK